MAAKLATADDHILAYGEASGALRNGGVSFSRGDEKPHVDVMQFDCGYLSPFFITDPERMEVAFENAYVFVYPGKISSRKDLLPLLAQFTNNGRPLLIIAEDVEGEALANLVVKKLSGSLQVAAVSVPGLTNQHGGRLQDIALLIGGNTLMEGLDMLKNMQICDLGHAKKVTIDKNRTVIESRVVHHQLRDPEPLKSSAVADLSRSGEREYSASQSAYKGGRKNATRNDRSGANGFEHGATADESRS